MSVDVDEKPRATSAKVLFRMIDEDPHVSALCGWGEDKTVRESSNPEAQKYVRMAGTRVASEELSVLSLCCPRMLLIRYLTPPQPRKQLPPSPPHPSHTHQDTANERIDTPPRRKRENRYRKSTALALQTSTADRSWFFVTCSKRCRSRTSSHPAQRCRFCRVPAPLLRAEIHNPFNRCQMLAPIVTQCELGWHSQPLGYLFGEKRAVTEACIFKYLPRSCKKDAKAWHFMHVPPTPDLYKLHIVHTKKNCAYEYLENRVLIKTKENQ